MSYTEMNILGMNFKSPIMTAAGPTSANYELLKSAVEGGAGGIVTKTISVNPARVPVPNIYSPAPGSLMNAELWSEYDYRYFIDTELPKIRDLGVPVILSLGYTPEDMIEMTKYLKGNKNFDAVEFSIHYVSKDVDNIRVIADSLKSNLDVPVFAKFSPAISDIQSMVKTLDPIVDGFAAINSVGPTLDFDIDTVEPYLGSRDGRGWLSGRAILPIGLHFVSAIAQATNKPILGVGGIRTAEDIIKYFMAGASAVQVCSQAILTGPTVYNKLNYGLDKWLNKKGYSNINDIKGLINCKLNQEVKYLNEDPLFKPVWDKETCNICKSCATVCTHEAISFDNKTLLIDYNKCVSCGLCTTTCPHDSLKMELIETI
ncbi:MAG: 4Fe-4S binding protein [bacterium]